MNSPTPISNDDPTEFGEIIEDAEPPGKREGLPAGFRMRATAHYVDQLETAPKPSLRAVAISAIESDVLHEAPERLVDSVRRHGVLEPLLVQHDPRGRQYRLIAGRSRLAAARAAGLREVPCVVHAITDAEANELIEATRDASRETAGGGSSAPVISLYPAQRDLESALTTIESCTPLLSVPSALARRGALQVIASECRRSHRLLNAMKVLTDGVPVRRAAIKPAELLERLGRTFREEQQLLLGSEPSVHVHADPHVVFHGDDELLLTAMTNALTALSAAAGDRRRELELSASAPPGTVTLELTDRSLVLSEVLVRGAFTTAWPVPDGDTVLVLLQAARRILIAHGGTLTMTTDSTRTTVRVQVPSDQTTRAAVDRAAN